MSSRFLKYVLFAFNLIIAVGSIVLLSYGIKYLLAANDGVDVFGSSFSFGALAISVGAIALVVSGFGCAAAFFENTILLTTYSGLLMGLFIVQLALGIMAVSKIDNWEVFVDNIKISMQDLFDNRSTDFATLQEKFECCGVSNSDDYDLNPAGYPSSCCLEQTSPCLVPFDEGCTSAFADVIDEYLKTIGLISIVFAIIEVVAALFSFIIRKRSTQFV